MIYSFWHVISVFLCMCKWYVCVSVYVRAEDKGCSTFLGAVYFVLGDKISHLCPRLSN